MFKFLRKQFCFLTFFISMIMCLSAQIAPSQNLSSAGTMDVIKLRQISEARIKKHVLKFEKNLQNAHVCKQTMIALCVVLFAGAATKFYFDMTKKKSAAEIKGNASTESKEAIEQRTASFELEYRHLKLEELQKKEKEGVLGLAKEGFWRGANVAFYSFIGVTIYNILGALWSGTGRKITNFCSLTDEVLLNAVDKKLQNSMVILGKSLSEMVKGDVQERMFLASGVVVDHAMFIDDLERLLALVELVAKDFGNDDNDKDISEHLSLQVQQIIKLASEITLSLENWFNSDPKNIKSETFVACATKIFNLYKHLNFGVIKIFETLKDAQDAA